MHDMGLELNLEKCASVHLKRGKYAASENLSIDKDIKALQQADTYKFLGKEESIKQMNDILTSGSTKEFFQRLWIIWQSDLTLPRKFKATKIFALLKLLYYMCTTEWPVDELRRVDRKVRSIISECSGRHPRESTSIFCLERKEGGRGEICVEETYHVMKLKTAHYVNTCIDSRLKQVKNFERIKQEKGRKNVFTDALKARSEVQLDIQSNLDESTTVVRIDQDRTTEICTSRPNMLTKYLKKALRLKHQEAIKSQNWQGKFLSMGWKNILDYIDTTHIEIMQQLLPAYVYQKERLNKQDLPVVCRACNSSEENLYHVMCN